MLPHFMRQIGGAGVAVEQVRCDGARIQRLMRVLAVISTRSSTIYLSCCTVAGRPLTYARERPEDSITRRNRHTPSSLLRSFSAR